MSISIIVARSINNVIGKKNNLPWRLADDLKYFKEKTFNHCVIMGRKTFNSLDNKPLKSRLNIIVTRNINLKSSENIIYETSIELALKTAQRNFEKEIFIIGGGQIYKQALPYVNKMYITEVECIIQGNIYFPDFDESKWELTFLKSYKKNTKNDYDFTFKVFEKK